MEHVRTRARTSRARSPRRHRAATRNATPSRRYDGFAVMGFPAFAPPVPSFGTTSGTSGCIGGSARFWPMSSRQTNRSRSRPARADGPRRSCAAARGHPVGLHRPRLLARLLLGRPARGSRAGHSCPGCSASAMTRCLRRAPARHGRRRSRGFPTCGRTSAEEARLSPAPSHRGCQPSGGGDAPRACAPELGRRGSRRFRTASTRSACCAGCGATTRPLQEPYAVFVGQARAQQGGAQLVDVASARVLDAARCYWRRTRARASLIARPLPPARPAVDRLARSRRGISVDASRRAADFSLGLAGAFQPRAHRGERARCRSRR